VHTLPASLHHDLERTTHAVARRRVSCCTRHAHCAHRSHSRHEKQLENRGWQDWLAPVLGATRIEATVIGAGARGGNPERRMLGVQCPRTECAHHVPQQATMCRRQRGQWEWLPTGSVNIVLPRYRSQRHDLLRLGAILQVQLSPQHLLACVPAQSVDKQI
jgi:hypothetical protein